MPDRVRFKFIVRPILSLLARGRESLLARTDTVRHVPASAVLRVRHPNDVRRQIEAAYATMWDIWQRGEAPRSFSVPPVAAAPMA